MGGPTESQLEAYTTLGFIAAHTQRVRLLALATAASYRPAGLLAKMVTTLDVLSGGRAMLGIGAGDYPEEAQGLGLPFPSLGERFDLLEETVQACLAMWQNERGDEGTFQGRNVRLGRALNVPQALSRPHPPILIAGSGERRTLPLVARYADEINISSSSAARVAEANERVRVACRAIGRAPGEVTHSAMTGVLVGRDEAEVRARVTALMATFGSAAGTAEEWLAERRSRWIMGTPDEARARVKEFEAAGASRLMLQTLLPRDLEMVRLLGEIFLA